MKVPGKIVDFQNSSLVNEENALRLQSQYNCATVQLNKEKSTTTLHSLLIVYSRTETVFNNHHRGTDIYHQTGDND